MIQKSRPCFRHVPFIVISQSPTGEPAAKPIEKAIYHRLCSLLRLNIQPLFVFDGPKRPWKRGGVAGRVDCDRIKTLIKTLDLLCIPHHRAPAEAEAECAKLQQEGIVDAVWSDDGDSLMFGADMLLRDLREDKGPKKKSDTHVRVYRSCKIFEEHGLHKRGLVLFATLSGGDYNVIGLRGCGPKLALKAARQETGLADSLCNDFCTQELLPVWRARLVEWLASSGNRGVTVPPNFPNWLTVKNYTQPCVWPADRLHNLSALRKGWERPLDELKLRAFLFENFNIWTKKLLRDLAPFLLVRRLRNTLPGAEAANNDLQMQVKRTKRAKKNAADGENKTKRTIQFRPLPLFSRDFPYRPDWEDWSVFTGKKGEPYDPADLVEADIFDCLLEQGAPGSLIQSIYPSLKRSASTATEPLIDQGQGKSTKKRVAEASVTIARETDEEASKTKTSRCIQSDISSR